MKAFVVDKYKKNSALRLADFPDPEMQGNDILVQIHAAGVNPLDVKIRDGAFKMLLPYRTPFVLGHDVAGTVIKVGSSVKRFKVGDDVYARPRDHRIGAFAEFIAIDQADAALKPKNLSMVEAASIPLVALTAWQALVEVGQLKPGQKVFIQAGSGGVGIIAIQLAKHLGATVATTTSTKNVELLKGLGADIVIDYKTQDFENILSGYDLVINSQDAKALEKSLKVVKSGGTIISISGPSDPPFAKAAGLNLLLRMVMRVMSYGIRKKAKKLGVNYAFLFMQANGQQLNELTSLIDSMVIQPVIDRVFQFDKTNEALAYDEAGHVKGKVVIQML